MRARIHRGAHEIGGSCVELENRAGERLVLDVGSPLDTLEGEEPTVPNIVGLMEADAGLRGILITHAHQDHWGLVDQTLPSVPLFMGQATSRILKEAAFWVRGLTREPHGFLEHREPFELGAYRITPFLNDHSAFDAYSLLVASHEQFSPAHLMRAVTAAEAAGFGAAMCSDHLAPWSERQGHSGHAWAWLGAALQGTDLPLGVVLTVAKPKSNWASPRGCDSGTNTSRA